MKNLSKLLISAAIAACAFASSAHAAPILVGSATWKTANDLTVIKDGNATYEFLDLTTTKGASANSAVSTYAPHGFALATNLDLSRLFTSFGLTYQTPVQNASITYLSITQAQSTSFISYFGSTHSSPASLGGFKDLTTGFGYACIGYGVCSGNAFTRDGDSWALGTSNIGVFLVREATASNVPEPASLALLGLGVAGIAAARRRRQK